MSIQRYKFITLSGLMGTPSLTSLPQRKLKELLAACKGASVFDVLSSASFPRAMKELDGCKKPCDWLNSLIEHSDVLKDRGLHYLVIDTLQHLMASQVESVLPMLKTLARQGVQIVVIDQHHTPIFFTSMREVVCTDDFMKIYVKSLWSQSRALGPTRAKTPVPTKPAPVVAKGHGRNRARPPARTTIKTGIQFMERIFVA